MNYANLGRPLFNNANLGLADDNPLNQVAEQIYGSLASNVISGTIVRAIMGQSNADGAANVDAMTPTGGNYGSEAVGHVPVYRPVVTSGANYSIDLDLADLIYIKTGDSATDRYYGAVSGPYGEDSIELSVTVETSAMSSLLGMAEEIKSGYHSGAYQVIPMKHATWGVPITNFLPSEGGSNYVSVKFTMKNFWRELIEAEKTASRDVLFQALFWAQGEAEASTARSASNVAHEGIVNWQDRFIEFEDWISQKLGFTPIIVLNQLIDLSEIYTDAQNDNIEGLCRYTVPVSMVDGSIGTIVDNGLSGNRASNRYFLKHDVAGAGAHFSADQYEALGRGVVNIEKSIGTPNGLTDYSIESIAPAFIEGVSIVNTATDGFRFTVWVDEACSLFVLPVASGDPEPTAQNVVDNGVEFSFEEIAPTYHTVSSEFVVTGFNDNTEYDVYYIAVESQYSHSSDVFKMDGTVTTDEIIPGVGAAWDENYSLNGIAMTFSNGGYTVIKTETGVDEVRSLTSKLSGKFYFELQSTGFANPRGGITNFDASASFGRNGGAVTNDGANRPMGRSEQVGDVIRYAYDRDNNLLWVADNAGNWNNDASADPASGVGGLSVTLTGNVFIYARLRNDAGAGSHLHTSISDWTYSAPSGFEVWA